MTDQGDEDMAGTGQSSRGISIDALSERVHTQGQQISTLAEDTKSQISGLRIEFSQGQSRLENLLGSLATKFEASSQASADRGRTNWIGLISTGAGAVAASWALITGLLSLRLAPIEDKQVVFQTSLTQLVGDVSKLSTAITDNFVPRKEIEANRADAKERRSADEMDLKEFKAYAAATYATKENLGVESDKSAVRSAANAKSIETSASTALSQSMQLRERIMTLEANVVTRREHEQRWSEFQKEIDNNASTERRDVDTLSARFEGLYPASTFLRDLQQRLQTTESKVIELEIQRGRIDNRQ